MSCFNINPEALKEFGRLIKAERERRKDDKGNEMSQRELAKIVNVSNSTISRIENGTINSAIDLEVFLAIAETINLTEEEIIYLYRVATYKNDKKQTLESNECTNKLESEINVLKSSRAHLNEIRNVKTGIQKVKKK